MDFKTTEQTIGWIRARYIEGTLILKPPYQRNPVWGARQKHRLIESVLLNMPIPEIFMQRVTDEEGTTTYAIVDGQQRVTSLLQFVGTYEGDEVEFNGFDLDMLEDTSPYKGKNFLMLTPEERINFYGYEFAVRELKSNSEEDMRNVFKRLNANSEQLKPQELRHATYTGPFARLVDLKADQYGDFIVKNGIISPSGVRRMADVEFMAELIIGVMNGPQAGNANAINEYYQQFEDYESEIPGEGNINSALQKTFGLIDVLLPNIKETRWSNKTDFYTLFVGLAKWVEKNGDINPDYYGALRKAITDFSEAVSRQISNKSSDVETSIEEYIKNSQRAPSDKSRRSKRHKIFIELVNSNLFAESS